MRRERAGGIEALERERWGLARPSGARRLVGRLVRGCGVRFYDFLHADIPCGRLRPHVPATPPGIVAGPAAPAAFGALLESMPAELASYVRRHLAPGDSCYVAQRDGETAGFSFLSRCHRVVFGLPPEKLPPATAFHFFGLVFPEHRRRGVYSALLHAMAADLGREGCLSLTSLVRRTNLPSVAAHRKAGARFESSRILKLPGARALHFGSRATGGER